MTDSEDCLLGYLLGDCDAIQRAAIERRVKNSPDVARRLSAVRRKYAVLLAGFDEVDAPEGLASSVCQSLFYEEIVLADADASRAEAPRTERRAQRVSHA